MSPWQESNEGRVRIRTKHVAWIGWGDWDDPYIKIFERSYFLPSVPADCDESSESNYVLDPNYGNARPASETATEEQEEEMVDEETGMAETVACQNNCTLVSDTCNDQCFDGEFTCIEQCLDEFERCDDAVSLTYTYCVAVEIECEDTCAGQVRTCEFYCDS